MEHNRKEANHRKATWTVESSSIPVTHLRVSNYLLATPSKKNSSRAWYRWMDNKIKRHPKFVFKQSPLKCPGHRCSLLPRLWRTWLKLKKKHIESNKFKKNCRSSYTSLFLINIGSVLVGLWKKKKKISHGQTGTEMVTRLRFLTNVTVPQAPPLYVSLFFFSLRRQAWQELADPTHLARRNRVAK